IRGAQASDARIRAGPATVGPKTTVGLQTFNPRPLIGQTHHIISAEKRRKISPSARSECFPVAYPKIVPYVCAPRQIELTHPEFVVLNEVIAKQLQFTRESRRS